MEPPLIRDCIIDALRLAASADAQRRYAGSVPIADVPAEVFCIWEDHYVPDSPWLRQQFNQQELVALARYEVISTEIASQLPNHLSVAEFQARSEWQALATAARKTLAALGEHSEDAV
ncbi:MAG: hypothetical protein MUF27_12975 [Acidobacteria bacterium]|jgi:hypothetical protein|nr:hypothetical protein [Acidobacteriota bacterium]